MANLRRSTVYTLIILALLGVLVGLGQATTANFTVEAGAEVIQPVKLVVEDRVLIQFRVVGATVNMLQFSIIFPNATERDFGEVGDFSYSFICDGEGEYGLRFINNDQTESKLVTLNYEVQHYVFGIPQMLFLALIIVLACVGGVAAFVLLGRNS